LDNSYTTQPQNIFCFEVFPLALRLTIKHTPTLSLIAQQAVAQLSGRIFEALQVNI
jgi:hypothetical protein